MKKIIIEDGTEGFEKLLGRKITIFCVNYIYTGELTGVNDECVLIADPKIVYETGSFNESEWENAQSLETNEFYIQKSAIESFGILK